MPARIIFKAHYLSGEKSKHIENYIQYMGTRPGVEIFDDDGSPVTEKQEQLIAQLIEDFGKEMTDTFEYEDYLAKPTKANASAAITACLDTQYGNTATKENYIDYIANRPRVEKLGEHGLFAQTDVPLDLEKIAHEVAHQGNNVWTDVISLRREDAAATGFDNAAAWRDLLRSKAETIARNYKIPMRDFVWYAAFHDEGHHPHVHFVCYSEGRDGYLTEKGIENIKSSLAHEIFRQEFSEIYDRQTQLRTELKDESTQLMERIARSMADGMHENTELTESVIALAERIDGLSGKKQYGYLPKDAKALVDTVVGELAQHEAIATLYDLWYEQKEQILGMYKEKMPARVPLAENKEFTSVKNMIIREADALSLSENNEIGDIDFSRKDGISDETIFGEDGIPVSEISIDGICLFDDLGFDVELPNIEKDILRASGVISDAEDMGISEDLFGDFPSDADAPPDFEAYQISARDRDGVYIEWSKEYKLARTCLVGSEKVERDFSRALSLFREEADVGNALAMQELGRIYANGLGVETDANQSHTWYEKAFQAFCFLEQNGDPKNKTYLQYRIGKMFEAGLGTQQDYVQAARWYSKAVQKEHKYAQYSLAGLYYRGNGVAQDFGRAFRLYEASANKNNPYACCEFAKMLRDGIGTVCNTTRANEYFTSAFNGFSALEESSPDDKLEYRLGQMLHTGTGVEKDDAIAEVLLQKSAEAGNVNAQYSLAMLWLNDETKDTDKAVSLLKKSADNENSMAQYVLGKLYLEGAVVEKDVLQAEKLFLLSAEQENAYAQYQLGKLYLSGNDSIAQDNEAALAWFQKSAEQNNASAQYALGKIYLSGEIAPKDVVRAKAMFEKSAGQGNAFAAYQLGKLYWNGEELDRNPEKAIAWWTKAAEQENPYACYALGKIYRDGTDAEADSEKAEKYFRSAYQGFLEIEKTEPNDNLEYRLGKMLHTGMGVEKDDAAAEVFFQKSAEAGNVYAQYELAMLWLNDETKDADKAVSLLTESADGGNVTAQYALGKLYLEGEVIQKDVLRAEKLFLKAAEQGNAFAQYQLGKLYLAGEDAVKKDTGKAVWWLEKSAEQNNSFAQYQLGNLYLNGDGVPQDISKAESYLLASAEQGNPYAMYRYGCLLRDEYEAKEEALRWIEKAAAQDHPGALYTLCQQDMVVNFPNALTYLNRLERLDRKENNYIAYYLGKLYLMDENPLKDVPKAIVYLQEAAEQENDMALYTLGKLYLADKDVPKNILFAVSCLERAAKLENSYAEYQLGQLYIRGVDVPQDISRGLEFLNSAADKNNDMALYALGKLHLAGENGVAQNVGKALDCFHRAADLDNAAACYQLGKIYLDGIFVQKNVGTALAYLEKSASLENDAAMFALGNLYLKGEDIPKDVTLAVRYFKAAADRGNDFAMYQLGKLYFLGEELPQDVQLGIRYMEQAIAKGNDTAMCFLGRAYLVGENVPKDIQKGLELLRTAANCGNEYAEKMLENFRANAAHTAISILHKLSLILQSNTSALMAKRPAMPAVDKKELLAILRKKEEQGIRYD